MLAWTHPFRRWPAPACEDILEQRSPYIVSPVYDWVFFLGLPLAAFLIGFAISGSWLTTEKFKFFGTWFSPAYLFSGILIHAHIVIVFFRSHGNASIFKLYPNRFIVVPLLLYLTMMSSLWVLISVAVLTTFWDVYHSGLQTFGFGRIYDSRAGNDPYMGRRLDLWMNHLLYAGPIVAGATMMAHFEDFNEFEEVESVFFTSIPVFMETNQRYFTWTILGAGVLFIAYYVLSYVRFQRQGYVVSFPKVVLLATTGLCSILTWGINTFGEAFFIMNFFHAVQYFGIVWWSEKKNMRSLFRLTDVSWGLPLTAIIFVGTAFLYGAAVQFVHLRWWWALTHVCSIMHFWYDGFIWSVRRKQV